MKTINNKTTKIHTVAAILVTGLVLTACGRDNSIDHGKLVAVAKLVSQKLKGIPERKKMAVLAFIAPRLEKIHKGVAACRKDYLTYKKATIVMEELGSAETGSIVGRKAKLTLEELIAHKGEVVSFFESNPDKLSEPCKIFLQALGHIRSQIQK